MKSFFIFTMILSAGSFGLQAAAAKSGKTAPSHVQLNKIPLLSPMLDEEVPNDKCTGEWCDALSVVLKATCDMIYHCSTSSANTSSIDRFSRCDENKKCKARVDTCTAECKTHIGKPISEVPACSVDPFDF